MHPLCTPPAAPFQYCAAASAADEAAIKGPFWQPAAITSGWDVKQAGVTVHTLCELLLLPLPVLCSSQRS